MTFAQWGVLILLIVSIFLNYIDLTKLSVAAPLIESEFALSPAKMGLLFSAFFWTYALLQLVGVAGWVADPHRGHSCEPSRSGERASRRRLKVGAGTRYSRGRPAAEPHRLAAVLRRARSTEPALVDPVDALDATSENGYSGEAHWRSVYA